MDGQGSSNAWGRVADDGTVYVRTEDGERPIASWQAGTPEEGLAHFVRRYEDLDTEVALLRQRLDSGAADPQHTLAAVARLSEGLPEAHVVGDLKALELRLADVRTKAEAKVEEDKAARSARAEEARARKLALVEEVERLAAEATQWKVTGDRIREVMTTWRDIKGVDRKTDQELWKRLTAAREGFHRRRGTHFAQLDVQRKEAQVAKETLVKEAETLAESTDWGPTASRLKQLMNDWKALGRAPRDAEQELWNRFRGAQDAFFAARSAVFTERDAGYQENQQRKEALIAEAEALDLTDPQTAQERLRDLQDRYEKVGRVPREQVGRLDARMGAAEQRIRGAVEEHWRRSNAASNPLLDQMREQVAKAERQLARAREAGDAGRIAAAESALASRRAFLDQAEDSAR